MKKRYLQKKVTLESLTTNELFTELIKRVRLVDDQSVYFIDSTSTKVFPQWSLYSIENKGLAVEVKQHD